jgi:hypothetical protein
MSTPDAICEFTLETHAGTRLKPLAIHPRIRDLVLVETRDGIRTTVQRSSLVENDALDDLFAQQPAETTAAA